MSRKSQLGRRPRELCGPANKALNVYLVYDPKGTRITTSAGLYGKHARYATLDQTSLRAVDVAHDPKQIKILCPTDINTHGIMALTTTCNTLKELYDELSTTLQNIAGKVNLPPDDGEQLIHYINTTNTPIIGAADVLLKQGNCSHSWVITINNSDHIDDPNMTITGVGPVDGYTNFMSSARGELQGQTAAAIVKQCVLKKYKGTTPQVHLYGDNQGVQSKCTNYTPRKMHVHREPNSDLLLEYHAAMRGLNKQAHWVASHQDKGIHWTTTPELKQLKLSHEAKLNIWCDKMAREA